MNDGITPALTGLTWRGLGAEQVPHSVLSSHGVPSGPLFSDAHLTT